MSSITPTDSVKLDQLFSKCNLEHLEDLKKLLKKESYKKLVNIKQGDDLSLLNHVSVYEGSTEVAKCLIDNNATVDNESGQICTSLILAVSKAVSTDDMGMVKLLLSNKANVDLESIDNVSPLSVAITGNNLEVAKVLISAKASVNNVRDDEYTLLAHAVKQNKFDATQLLLESKADVDISVGNRDEYDTPLFLAVSQNFFRIAKLLLESNATADLENHNGLTPLWFAAFHGSAKMVHLLLDHGVSGADSPDGSKVSPILCAAGRGLRKVLKILLPLSSLTEVDIVNNVDLSPELKIKLKLKFCGSCNATGVKLKVCSRCHSERYWYGLLGCVCVAVHMSFVVIFSYSFVVLSSCSSLTCQADCWPDPHMKVCLEIRDKNRAKKKKAKKERQKQRQRDKQADKS
jgi:ankyrin repeat protein